MRYIAYPQSYKRPYFFKISTYIFAADIIPKMLKLFGVTKVKVFFLVLVYTFSILANFDWFEFSAAILEKGLLNATNLPGRSR